MLVDTIMDKRVPSDGLVDQWFTFETAGPLVPLFVHLPEAVIVHSAGTLRVTAIGQEFVFVVAGRGTMPPEDDVDAITTRLVGIGLSHNRGKTNVRIAGQLDRSGRVSTSCEECGPFEIDPDGGGGGGTCDAGGIGSTACSLTQGSNSCSVSCASPKYACCTWGLEYPTCKCK